MVDAGVMHRGKNGMLHVPIPCFVDYLKSKLDWLAAKSTGSSTLPDPPETVSHSLPDPGI